MVRMSSWGVVPHGGTHDLGVALSARLGLSTGCKNRNGAIIADMRYSGNGRY